MLFPDLHLHSRVHRFYSNDENDEKGYVEEHPYKCNNKDDIHCQYSCILCGLLIPENIRYAFIQHHKSGFEISSNIQYAIQSFCNCDTNNNNNNDNNDNNDNSNLDPNIADIHERLFGNEGRGHLTAVYSKRYMVNTFQFELTHEKDDNQLQTPKLTLLSNSNSNSTPIATKKDISFSNHAHSSSGTIDITQFLQRINNSVWFHFTRKPLSTILSAYHYHSQCIEAWDHDPYDVAQTVGKPRWQGDVVFKYLLQKQQQLRQQQIIDSNSDKSSHHISFQQTLDKIVLNKYSKDRIKSFFGIYYQGGSRYHHYDANNIGPSLEQKLHLPHAVDSINANPLGFINPANQNGMGVGVKEDSNDDNDGDNGSKLMRRSMLRDSLGREIGLFYFDKYVFTKRKVGVRACYQDNYFSNFVYNKIDNDKVSNQQLKRNTQICQLYSDYYKQYLKTMSKSKSKSKSKIKSKRRRSTNKKHKNIIDNMDESNSTFDDIENDDINNVVCNFGLFYEIVRYSQCEWLQFFTVHTMSKLLSNDMDYYKEKYGLNIKLFEFEMSQWQNYHLFAKNIDIILDAINFIDSVENKKKIQSYFKTFENVDETMFNLTYFRNELRSYLLGLSVSSRMKSNHVTMGKYNTETEATQILRYNHDICILIKYLTLSLYFDWEYDHIC